MAQGSHENGNGAHSEGTGTTATLVASAVGDRCVTCGSALSSDQRYCVVCGERRGAPRFALPEPTAPVTAGSAGPRRRPSRDRGRFGAGFTLVAGVGTLLLAMLVGFLIGHDASSGRTRTITSGQPRITINETGGGSTAGTAAASQTTTSPTHQKAQSTPKISKKQATAEGNAAKKVLGGNNTPPPTQTVGSSCKAGSAGCNGKTHKFNGSFFGQ